uniref:DUF5916 domain-containing protein n=5 Tax=Roseivirga sp. TaxID=1964215 RepID=UPI004047A1FC
MKFNQLVILISLLLLGHAAEAQQSRKSFEAVRTEEKINVDGIIDEDIWCQAPVQTDFVQNSPNPGAPASRKTEVRFLYDDNAIYISAQLFDQKEEVFNLLTNRDNIGNSDYFGVSFDPYNAGLNGVGLFVTVAGVQYDTRYSNGGNSSIWRNDEAWNAVWLSSTKVYDDYWVVEMKIPYAVLRFNSKDVQNWGINFVRQNSSLNEASFWNPIDPQIDGYLNQSGLVTNIKNVKAPTRLFFYPYVSTVFNRSTATGFTQPQLNGGMDIKYGINDAFTLDMTLIPDFSGVRSDNQVLNLSPFEVRFDENRQFFTEGVELFNKAGLFYSRRIGGTFGNITEQLAENEEVTFSPQAAQLINSSKITGRTNSGLGIGFFNAITDRTFLTVENTETGTTREVEGDPMTNFNVLVLDQNLKNNSSVTLTNTSVLRAKNGDDANVTGFNFSLNDRNLNWRTSGFVGFTRVVSYGETGNKTIKAGSKYNIGIRKNRGKYQFGLSRNVESDDYDINDLGFLRQANEISHRGDISLNQFNPVSIFNNYRIRFEGSHNRLYNPNEFSSVDLSLNLNGTFRNFWNANIDLGLNPSTSYDFFEARESGYVLARPKSQSVRFNINSDSRKKIRLSARYRYWTRNEWDQTDQSLNFSTRVRIGERAEISHNIDQSLRSQERGYATKLYDTNDNLQSVIIGQRDVNTLTNTVDARYIFTNRMGVTFRVRHYWSTVEYQQFYNLSEADELTSSDYTGIDPVTLEKLHDRNFNTFNIDMEYNWQFAPGSEIRAIWKRSIGSDDKATDLNFFDNFSNTWTAPNVDSITIRLVYFIDYLNVRNIFSRS